MQRVILSEQELAKLCYTTKSLIMVHEAQRLLLLEMLEHAGMPAVISGLGPRILRASHALGDKETYCDGNPFDFRAVSYHFAVLFIWDHSYE